MVREPTEALDDVTLAKLRLRALSERHATTPAGVTRLLLPDRRTGGGGRSLLKLAGVAAAALAAGVVLARYPGVRRAAGNAISVQLLEFTRRK